MWTISSFKGHSAFKVARTAAIGVFKRLVGAAPEPGAVWHEKFPAYPEGPSTQHLRTLVSKNIQGMAFGTRVLKYWVVGPSGLVLLRKQLRT